MINHPSYNPHTGALAQDVATAIRDSVQESRIVHIEHSDALAAALALECEGETDTPEVHEFWGVDCDGETWRVHLDR